MSHDEQAFGEDDEATQMLDDHSDALSAAIAASRARRIARHATPEDDEVTHSVELPRPAIAARAPAPGPTPAPVEPVHAKPHAPFPWSTLRAIGASELASRRRLTRMLPGPGALGSVADTLETLTGVAHSVTLRGIHVHAAPHTPRDLEGSYVTRVSMPPDPESGLLSINASFIAATLGAMLGEDAMQWRAHGPLDARDFGLTTYAALRVLEALSTTNRVPPVVVSSSPLELDELHEPIEGGREVYELAFDIERAGARGLARLWLPAHLVAAMEVFAPRGAPELPAWLGDVALRARVVLAQTSIPGHELSDLGAGDVLVLERHGLSHDRFTPSAPARIQLDASHHVDATVELVDGRLVARVGVPDDLESGEEEMEETNTTDGSEAVSPEVSGALLDAAAVSVRVVVGEARMSVAELARLRAGEVLELGAPIGAPVELRLADGELVGRGELVDVEGSLGVRVMTIGS